MDIKDSQKSAGALPNININGPMIQNKKNNFLEKFKFLIVL